MSKLLSRMAALLAASALPLCAHAQGVVQQVGPVTAGHPAIWWANGQLSDRAITSPVVSACGAGSPSLVGNDYAGFVTVGTSTSACTVTFASAYNTGTACIVQDYNATSPIPYVSAISTTAFTVTWGSAYSGSFFYLCQGLS